MADTNRPASLSERMKAAGLPTRATTKELAAMGRITFLAAEPAQARNPETGEMGSGYMVTVADNAQRKYRAFIGGIALCRVLDDMVAIEGGFPFVARIVREGEGEGHPYTFAD